MCYYHNYFMAMQIHMSFYFAFTFHLHFFFFYISSLVMEKLYLPEIYPLTHTNDVFYWKFMQVCTASFLPTALFDKELCS